MEVTMFEAMRIRKQLNHAVESINYATSMIKFGRTFDVIKKDNGTQEDEEHVQDNLIPVRDFLKSFVTVIGMLDSVNNVIDIFNFQHGVQQLLRDKGLTEKHKSFLETIASKRSYQTRVPRRGEDGDLVYHVEKFEAEITKTEIRDMIRLDSHSLRDIRNQLEKLNAETVQLPFSSDEMDSALEGLK